MTPRRRLRRPSVRRAAPALPTGFTLGNLFFGFWAIVSASRGDFERAVLYIVFGGLCDAIDGRVARATNSGSEFGEQLDSLVDAITFGLAPAMIVYFFALPKEGPSWMLSFFFTACAVARLARFNVTQAGASKSYFIGMPSPAAGGTLATYYWFTQTSLYQQTVNAGWRWHDIVFYMLIGLGILMVSPVPYPSWPKIGFRTWPSRIGLLVVLAILAGIVVYRGAFFFPFGIAYAVYGLVRIAILGLWERRQGADVVEKYEQYANEFADDIDNGYPTDDEDEPVAIAPVRIAEPARRPGRPTPRATPPVSGAVATVRPTPAPSASVDAEELGDAGGTDGAARPRRKRRRRPRGDRPPGPGHTPSTDGTE